MENLHMKNLNQDNLMPKKFKEIYELAKLITTGELENNDNPYDFKTPKFMNHPLYKELTLTNEPNINNNYRDYKNKVYHIMYDITSMNFSDLIRKHSNNISLLKKQGIINKDEELKQTIQYLITLKKDYDYIIIQKLNSLCTMEFEIDYMITDFNSKTNLKKEYKIKKEEFQKEFLEILDKNINNTLEYFTKKHVQHKLQNESNKIININDIKDDLCELIMTIYQHMHHNNISTEIYFENTRKLIKQYIDEELKLHTKKVIGKLYQIKQKEVIKC